MSLETNLKLLVFVVSLLVAGPSGVGEAATPLGTGAWPNIAAEGSNIYVVWEGGSSVLLRRSLDGGNNFLPEASFALNPSFAATTPDVAVSGSNVYLVWADSGAPGGNDILFSRSADGGVRFDTPINLSNTPLDGTEGFPRIAVSGSTIHVVWYNSTEEIFYTRSTNGGLHFLPPINLSNSPGRSRLPAVATSGPNVFVAWGEATSGSNPEVLLTRSTNGGENFLPPENISNTPTPSGSPGIAVDDLGGVFVAWKEELFGAGDVVLLRRSTDNGVRFSPLLNISRNPAGSVRPSIAVNGADVFAVWTDFGQPDNSNTLEIFYSRSMDGGSTFSSPPVNISNAFGVSEFPRVAATGSNAYVVWRDQGQILFFRDVPVPDPAPKITNVDPPLGPVGATLTLTGFNFGATQGFSNVFAGKTLAQVLAWSDTQVRITVPSLNPGSYPVALVKGAIPTNPAMFQVIAPLSISGEVKVNGNLTPGITVKLTGTASVTVTTNAFGTYTFGSLAPGTYTVMPSDPSFSFKPSEAHVPLIAKNATAVNFSGTTLTGPVLSSVFPSQGRKGNLITLEGNSFGEMKGTVWFGSTPATDDSIKTWTSTTIAVYVPSSLSLGSNPIQVQNASGQLSQSLSFTVNNIPNPVVLVRGLLFPISLNINSCGGDPTDVSDWNDWKNLLRSLLPYSGPFMVTVPGDDSFNAADRIDGSDGLFNNARRLEGHIQSVQQRFEAVNGYKPKVDLIGHSMGGLIMREYLGFESVKPSPPTDKVIMIGTPNKGAPKADFFVRGPGKCWVKIRPALEDLTTTFVKNSFNPSHLNHSLVDDFLIAGLIFDPDLAPNPLNLSSGILCTSTDVFKTLGRCDDMFVPWVSALEYDPLRPPKRKYSVALRHDTLNNDFDVLKNIVLHILSNNPPPSTVSSLSVESASIPELPTSLALSLDVTSALSSESLSLQAIEVDGQLGLSKAPPRTISQDQVQTIALPIENTPQATFLLAWGEPASDLDFVLMAPDGTRIDPNFATANPDTVEFSTVPAGENLLLEKLGALAIS